MGVHDTFDLFGEPCRPKVDGILKQRFLLPPFSVLSARDGDWQERKRMWLSLGIQSELGRGDTENGAAMTNASSRAMELAGGFKAHHGLRDGE